MANLKLQAGWYEALFSDALGQGIALDTLVQKRNLPPNEADGQAAFAYLSALYNGIRNEIGPLYAQFVDAVHASGYTGSLGTLQQLAVNVTPSDYGFLMGASMELRAYIASN
jgi:hypothetical protein